MNFTPHRQNIKIAIHTFHLEGFWMSNLLDLVIKFCFNALFCFNTFMDRSLCAGVNSYQANATKKTCEDTPSSKNNYMRYLRAMRLYWKHCCGPADTSISSITEIHIRLIQKLSQSFFYITQYHKSQIYLGALQSVQHTISSILYPWFR